MKARAFLFGKLFVYYSINIFIMPILNFLKWLNIGTLSDKVVGEAIIMTANPTQKENEYESIGITVSQLLDKTKALEIPELILRDNKEMGLSVAYLPTGGSDLWQQYNPKVYLFRYGKKKSRSIEVIDPVTGKRKKKTKQIPAGFRHVPHQNGFQGKGKFYSGQTRYPYNTEFPLMINQPYMTQPLFGFDPYQFFMFNGQQPLPKDIGRDKINDVYPSNRKKDYARSVYFRFAIGIDNPDKTSEFPVLFGEMTETLQALVYINQDGLVGVRTNIVPTGIKRHIP